MSVAVKINSISSSLKDLLKGFGGVWGAYVKDLENGAVVFEFNQDEAFPAASLSKIAIAMSVFSQVDKGVISFDDNLSLVEDYKLGGSGVLKHLKSGLNLSLLDVVKLMLLVSDNTAAKMLVKKSTPWKINQYLQSLGLKVTKLKVDGDKFGYGLTTPKEIAGLLEGLFSGKYFSPELSKTLIGILKDTHNDLAIRRYLPYDRYDDDVPLEVACKTGSLPGVRNAVAVVFGDNPYVISLLSKDLVDKAYKPDNEGLLSIASFSKKVYDFFSTL